MQGAKRDLVLLKFNQIMEYDWGCSSHDSLIGQFSKGEHKRYAELWMGTHPKGMSKVGENMTLSQYLEQFKIGNLPFLFKVLCIQKPLSIQLHPNKKQAERLHAEHSQLYDDNEKPQMFLTLTEFECLFGIISAGQLQKLFTVEPFWSLKSKKSKQVKQIIAELLSFSEEERKKKVELALKNIGIVFPERKELLQRLQEEFPFDEGILVSCLLRYKVLLPGTCFAIAAGVPHAYLKGSCLEIMKNSDNVIRLGLTPKLKDVKTMLEIMQDEVGLDGLKVEKGPHGYRWNNLSLNKVESKGDDSNLQVAGISIGIIFEGQFVCDQFKMKAGKGDVFLIQPGNYKVKGAFVLYLGGYFDV